MRYQWIKSIPVLMGMVLLISLEGNAQKLMGLVTEKNASGVDQALPGANVYWLGTSKGTNTGENGVFMIDLVEGSTKLVISFVGYKSDTLTITSQTSIKVVLASDQVLDEVTVQGWRSSSGLDQLKPINTVVMTEKELFKAACCNLSESFETNPSVDVAFTDAITGTRQIQMLGLAGPNTMISIENMPGVRGLAGSQGIQFIPGTWINSIQVTKGVGSVVNGYESIAGQINVELKKPEESETFYLNGYVNESGRSELNANVTAHPSKKWATTLLLHGSTRPFEMDQNKDGFLDFPTGSQINFINRWVYSSGTGWLGQFGVKALRDTKQGGQTDFTDEDKFTTNRYGFEINTDRYEAWGKVGYQFKGQPYKSVGLQLSATQHQHDSYFGFNIHEAEERSAYANLIYQSIIGNNSHKFKTGLSFLYDDYDEQFAVNTVNPASFIIIENQDGSTDVTQEVDFGRTENVAGAFFEYDYDNHKNIQVIAGMRVDYHNLLGTLFTPRVHTRFLLTETTALRASAGRGIRLANLLTENTGVLASARQLVFTKLQSDYAYGFKPDMAWNYGLNFSQDFTLDYRSGNIVIDYFYTDFENQAVVDFDRSTRQANFFGLTDRSFSHSLQFQVDYELIRRLDIRLAYRWLDVQTDYLDGRLQRPLIPKHRAFVNLGYETRNGWKFDYTVQWLGEQRIPDTSLNEVQNQLPSVSPSYVLMSSQVTKDFKKPWSVYLGVENLSDYTLDSPIVGANDPFNANNNFDTSMVWGPIFGRMFYAGFRYRIGEAHQD
ncbi:TonB-dependent receptor [Chryseotalea sanaruensis]|uniref:TonB-dependent receptor n=1 Tax=Chryseotalea sanaruensis TaxID=2482724 RepID=A0A401UAI3_9BACT|nr:TonB-dependent receptor [Chryseotalea sanaruensis]GCC51854.1 TonB-dependent receptor [Chryseotalea sanaruensis]